DKNPHNNHGAKLLHLVEEITPEVESYGGNPTSLKGVGGMRTKIMAAKICGLAGCHTIIASSREKDILLRLLDGEEIGTLFMANKEVHTNRIRWILLSRSCGSVEVDEGAKEAIKNSMSLLPSGITNVNGDFRRGDIIEIRSNGEVFAKGITDYSSSELTKIKGQHTNQITDLLGYKNYNHVIKKENIGLF
ncbi:PUA domain-containing protein, partial [uncultured Methanomethylovorans sp.]